MNSYLGETPDVTFDPDIPRFFEKFYATSDNPETHEEYAKSFTDNAEFVMGLKRARGYSEILEIRKGLWGGPVKTRKHTLKKIFPFGDNSNEVMLYGNVKYGLINGKEVVVEWAGRALMTKTSKGLKMGFYQVYLDSSPVANALKD